MDKVEEKIWFFEKSLSDSVNMSAKLSALGKSINGVFDGAGLLMKRYGNDQDMIEEFIMDYMQKYQTATKEYRAHLRNLISID